MRTLSITGLIFSLAVAVACLSVYAGDSPAEKAFVDSYKKAFESKDTAALQSFLYTQGSDPGILEFYKMMQSAEAGGKVSQIELVDLTPDEAKKAAEPQESPNGAKVCLTLKPTKKLKFTIEKKDENGSSSSETSNFLAEKDGKFVIPVPGKCK